MNKVTLIGKVGEKPELKPPVKGLPYTVALSIVTEGRQGDEEAQAEWHRVIARGGNAKVALETILRGDLVYVEGALHYGSYESGGVTIPTHTILVEDIRWLG